MSHKPIRGFFEEREGEEHVRMKREARRISPFRRFFPAKGAHRASHRPSLGRDPAPSGPMGSLASEHLPCSVRSYEITWNEAKFNKMVTKTHTSGKPIWMNEGHFPQWANPDRFWAGILDYSLPPTACSARRVPLRPFACNTHTHSHTHQCAHTQGTGAKAWFFLGSCPRWQYVVCHPRSAANGSFRSQYKGRYGMYQMMTWVVFRRNEIEPESIV